MTLKPAERILLLNILPPAEGSVILLRGVRKLRRDLAFSDDEILRWNVKSDMPGHFRWDGDEAVEIEIAPHVAAHLADCLRKTEAAGKLHEGLLDIYESLVRPAL